MNNSCYDKSEIYNLVNNMLKSNSSVQDDLGWNYYFGFNINRSNSFIYLSKYTTLKPRDFVRILRITQEQCKRSNSDNPTDRIITSDLFNRAYSTYFVDSIRTGLTFYYDEKSIDILFSFLKFFRSCNFNYLQFANAIEKYTQKEQLIDSFGDVNDILNLLFDFNMICSVENGPYYRWKYREVSIANYDYHLPAETLTNSGKFRFHPALEKEFGLYLK